MSVGEWVAVVEYLFLAIYGSERHVTKRGKKKKKATAVMKLVEICTMGWITSLPRPRLVWCWQVAQTCSETNEATSAAEGTN